MAMASLLLPSLSSSSPSLLLSSHYSSSSSLKSSPLSPPLKLSSARRWSFVFVVSASSTANAGSTRSDDETKRMALERYGLDPSDFTPQRSRRRREGEEKSRRGRRRHQHQQDVMAAPVGERKPPRTTHKLLQVLGGKARRKKLLSPKGMDVRPMMEVVRGAAFDILQVAGGCPASLRPGRWLDLYSGTGSVGIEAISRGCAEAHFVEMDPWVVSEVLKPNLEWTGFLDYSVIHTIRVESFLEQAGKSLGKDKSFDYVSVTPPYTAVDYTILMEQLGNSPLIGEDCFILVEYALKTPMADSCGHLIKVADRRFGRTNLVVYGPTWAQKKKRKSERSVVPPLDRASD